MAESSMLGSRRQWKIEQSCLCNHRKGTMVQKNTVQEGYREKENQRE